MPSPASRARIISRLSGRLPDSTSETLLRLPINGTRSTGDKSACSIRNLIASIGSGSVNGYRSFS